MKLTPSQISSYVFCSQSWWLCKTKGFKPTQQTLKGEQHHKQISENQPKARAIYIGVKIGFAVLVIFIVYRIMLGVLG